MVDALRAALEGALRSLSPKSESARAIRFGVKSWPALLLLLLLFLDDGRLKSDDNIAGRAIRNIVVGRRNWLFAGNWPALRWDELMPWNRRAKSRS